MIPSLCFCKEPNTRLQRCDWEACSSAGCEKGCRPHGNGKVEQLTPKLREYVVARFREAGG